MTWRNHAACDGSAVDFFDHNQAEQALAICAGCDVREPCLADALDRGDRMGVRGGHSFHSKDRDSCGTPAGYQAHRRAREAICEPCRTAQAQDARDRRANGRAGKPKGKPGRPAEPIEHGTVSGYRKHWRRGEKACDPCKQAYRQYDAERRKAA